MEIKNVKCLRCRNKHKFSERIDVKGKDGWSDSTCPRCGSKPYYEVDKIDTKFKPQKF